jgi:type VI secretion system VgrG family protein
MTQAKFKFTCDANGGDQFTVVSFTGRERISELYRYEIEVKAPLSANIDLDDVLDGLVHFVTEQNGVEFPVNGILSSFEEFKTVQNYAHYKAILVPSIWKLSNYKTNEIFYQSGDEGDIDAGLTITDIITQVLEKSGMTSADFDMGGLSSKLLKREYTCQYGESDFDFMSRLLENEGVFYYFEQSATEEKIVFVNDLNYLSLPRPKLIFDVAAMANSQDNCVFGWSCRKQRLAERVVVRNYNPEEPSLDVSDTTAIDSRGQGTEYIYGQNVQTDTEATYLSQIRAEEQICRKTQFFGESSVSRLQAGYLFLLDQHPNTKYNASEYLAIEVNHEGHNLDMSIAHDANKQTRPQYQNSFVAISADVQYRPPLKTIKPRITGTLHARIDGELLSEYAQLDSEGRYKVSMPFDFHNDDHPEGLASARVRMMQPYAGKGRGMQFPMAKGTEVLLTFVDGDPDRPLIAGAINTATAPGPVTADNQTESVIQTGGANKIRMEDKFGSERVMLESPAANSWIRVGATNDPIILLGESPQYVDIGAPFTDSQATSTDSTDPSNPVVSPPFSANETKDLNGNIVTINTSVAGEYILKYVSGSDSATRRVTVCDLEALNDLSGSTSDGIRIRSAGNLWFEARSKYGDYHLAPSALEGISLSRGGGNSIGDLYDKFSGSAASYMPTGMKNMAGGAQLSFKQHVLPNAHLRVSSLDTITTQEGNIYDFGGYWNYNLGNSYAENHMTQSPELNFKKDGDLLEIKGSVTKGGGPSYTNIIWPSDTLYKGERTDTNQDQSGDGGININNGLPTTDTTIKSGVPGADNEKATNDARPEIDFAGHNVWVDKSYGDSYEYKEGAAISVSRGDTLDVIYGGTHIEAKYDNTGHIRSWSKGGKEKSWTSAGTLVSESKTVKSASGVITDEKKYDYNTGDLCSHSTSTGSGMGMAKFEFDYSNSVSMNINTGSVICMDSFLGFKMTMNNFGGGKMHMENFLGISMTMENSLGAIFKMENAPCVFQNTNGTMKVNMPGFEARNDLSKAEMGINEIKAAMSNSSNAAFQSLANGITSIA